MNNFAQTDAHPNDGFRKTSSAPTPDGDEIQRAISTLHPGDVLIELRALHKSRKRTDAGYFDADHRELLIDEAVRLNSEGAAVYINLNQLNPQLLARYANRVESWAKATATDANILHRRWLLVDIDPQRPKDTSATAAQLEAAVQRGAAIIKYLSSLGWPKPVSADSGNGLHFMYSIDLPNDKASLALVNGCLAALAARFDDDAVKVDRSVGNAARIVKLHGTVANKGDNVPAAPWRLSKLRIVPDKLVRVSIEQLQALAAEAVTEKKYTSKSISATAWTEGDMQAFLDRGGIESVGPESHDGVLRWKLTRCPFNPDHGFGESAVFLRLDGVLGFDCRHNGCQDKHWHDLRELVDGPRDQRRYSGNGSATRNALDAEWPQPQPLPDGLPPVTPFDYEMLPTLLHQRVADIAERMQCPPDFPAVALIVALSSLVGRRCGIAPKRADDWTVVPNLWGMAIGRPGIMKTPPIAETMKPLQVLQARAIEHFNQQDAEHAAAMMVHGEAERVTKEAIRKMLKEGKRAAASERAQEAVSSERVTPVCRRYIVNDSTVEKLGEILNENPFGVLLFRDELNGFFRTLERQGHEADRAFYLECWNGDGAFTYDRIGRGTLHITGACLSILGSIQPGPLSDLVRGLRGSGDDGLLQRFQLAVWPDGSPEWHNVDRAPDLIARDAVQSVIERLDAMTAQSLGADPGVVPLFRFSDEAQGLFDVWRESLELRLRGDTEHPMLEAHLSKYRSLVPSLALVIHLTEQREGPVALLALERAIAWAEYLESHARRIYAPAISPDMDAARALAKRIKAGEVGASFALRDVYNKGWSGLSTRDEVAAAVRVLTDDYDWLRSFEETTPGRTRTVHRVNPAVLPAQRAAS